MKQQGESPSEMTSNSQHLRLVGLIGAFFAAAIWLIFCYWPILATISIRLFGFYVWFVALGSIAFLCIGLRNIWTKFRLNGCQNHTSARKAILFGASATLAMIIASLPLVVFVPFDRWLIVCAFIAITFLIPTFLATLIVQNSSSGGFDGLKAAAVVLVAGTFLTLPSLVPGCRTLHITRHTYWPRHPLADGSDTSFSVRTRVWKWYYGGQEINQIWDSSSIQLYVNEERIKTLLAPRADWIGEMWANDEYLHLVFNAHNYTPTRVTLDGHDDDLKKLILRFDQEGRESLCADITAYKTFDTLFDFVEMPDRSTATFNWWREDLGRKLIDVDLGQCRKSDYFSVRSRFQEWSHWRTRELKYMIRVLNADLSSFSYWTEE